MQKYQDVVLNQNGNPVSGVQVTVTDLAGSPVAVYSSNAIGLNVNPLTSDNNGRFSFYAPDGRYSLTFTFGGNVVASISDILLEDPMDGSDAVFNDVTMLGSLSDASKITSAAVGGISATNVQAALAELDSDKASNADLSLKVNSANLAAPGGSALVGFQQSGAGAVARTGQDKLRETVSVKDFGAVGDGVTDDSEEINTAASSASIVEVSPGSYLYAAAATADPAKFEFKPGAQFVGTKALNKAISVREKSGKLIGFQHNYNETRNDNIATPITTGRFVSPPVSDASQVSGVDVLAYWYNDFGLEATRAAGGALGSTQWYTWQWNHTDETAYGAYDPQRHPLLGWYRGDDPVALDWISYWLREAGVSGVILTIGKVDTTTWSSNTIGNHWLYQLFNNVPNFKGLKYVLSSQESGTQVDFEDHWTDMKNNVLSVHRNYHVTTINGKTYGTIFLYDMGVIRTGVFASNANFETWMKGMATYFQSHGHDGVCVLGRNGSYYTSQANARNTAQVLNDFGVYVFEANYGDFPGAYAPATVYEDYVNQFDTAYDAVKFRCIPNVMTGRSSKCHPSGWTQTGTTPGLFGKVLRSAANAAIANETIPNIVTVYNVSEWGEGGASLQPNMQDGFSYLDAVRQVGSANNTKSRDIVTDLFADQSATKTGLASDAVAFTPFTYTVTDSQSVCLVELTLVAMENTGNFANVANKYVFTLRNTGGTLVASVVTTDYALSNSNANYSISADVAITVVNATTATVSITLTKGGAIGWNNCEYVVKTNIISTDQASVD